jgi:hypothetical protein
MDSPILKNCNVLTSGRQPDMDIPILKNCNFLTSASYTRLQCFPVFSIVNFIGHCESLIGKFLVPELGSDCHPFLILCSCLCYITWQSAISPVTLQVYT